MRYQKTVNFPELSGFCVFLIVNKLVVDHVYHIQNSLKWMNV